jgi:hypothetical protein
MKAAGESQILSPVREAMDAEPRAKGSSQKGT